MDRMMVKKIMNPERVQPLRGCFVAADIHTPSFARGYWRLTPFGVGSRPFTFHIPFISRASHGIINIQPLSGLVNGCTL